MTEAEQNPEIEPRSIQQRIRINEPSRADPSDPDPGHRGPVTILAGPGSRARRPEPSPEPPHGDPPAQEPGISTAPPLVLTSKPVPEDKPAKAAPPKPKKQDEEPEQSPFSVTVGQVYDGPLDLLLDLIRKQDIDIYDIPIAKITAQFLAYVDQLKATDMDVAGEFIYMASLLIHIKSKMLLPRTPAGPDDAAEDPRRELVERLLEHERFKNAAQMLQQKQMLEAATWTNPGVREFRDDVAAEPEIAADTVDLVRIFRDILERARNRPILNVEEDSVTVGQMIQFLTRRLTMEDKPRGAAPAAEPHQVISARWSPCSWRCSSSCASRPSCSARTAPSARSSSRRAPASIPWSTRV